MVAPAVAVVVLAGPRPPRAAALAALAGGAALLLIGWLGIVRLGYGAWFPVNRPTPWIVQDRPYLRLVVNRPRHFYVTGLLLVAPVYGYAISALTELRRRPWLRVPAVWAASGGISLTGLALAGLGGGFQLRYLAPMMPALCLLTAAGIARLPWWWAAPAPLAGAVTFTAAFWNAAQPDVADPLPAVVACPGSAHVSPGRTMDPASRMDRRHQPAPVVRSA